MDPSPASDRTVVADILAALGTFASSGGGQGPATNDPLAGLAVLHEVRALLDGWEARLIAAARDAGASWADIAPMLGVASRQAAERRYLRLRTPVTEHPTQDLRVLAERDRRAGERAVGAWAREHGADLRQLAGQISALTDLGPDAQLSLDRLHATLGQGQAADLLPLLADAYPHLTAEHSPLARRVRAVHDHTEQVRQDTTEIRQGNNRHRAGRRSDPT